MEHTQYIWNTHIYIWNTHTYIAHILEDEAAAQRSAQQVYAFLFFHWRK